MAIGLVSRSSTRFKHVPVQKVHTVQSTTMSSQQARADNTMQHAQPM